MPTIIVMPQLGESVAEGIIGKWLKNEGDIIQKDEPLVEVITDKVNAEIPSPVAGILERITQPEFATVAVGQEIAVISDPEGSGQPAAADPATAAPAPAGTGTPHLGVPASVPDRGTPPGLPITPSPGGNGQATSVSATAAPPSSAASRGERVRSSPLVRRLADQYGINLSEVEGTGIGGRVSKHDVISYVEQRQRTPSMGAASGKLAPSAPASGALPSPPASAPIAAETAAVALESLGTGVSPRPAPTAPRYLGSNEELVRVTPLRKMIAERMAHSVYTIPHATTNAEVDMTNVVRFRDSRKDDFRSREGVALSIVAFVIKATVEALKDFPLVNAEWAGDGIILKKDININVAVDAPEGLTTPVIHHADEKSLAGLSKSIYDLAMRARNKKLKIEDMQGGTFTVNNTGALGSVSGVSIINYPQGGILSSGTVVKRPVVLEHDGNDLIAVRSMMNLSFTFDHRLLDGGYAAAFVNAAKETLESWPADYPLY